jgi:hypothetical protein
MFLTVGVYSPSSRVATAERKLKLVNDSLAKSFTTKSVKCARCAQTVALEGDGDYDLTLWYAHKSSCTLCVLRRISRKYWS